MNKAFFVIFYAFLLVCLFGAREGGAKAQFRLTLANDKGESLFSAPVNDNDKFAIRYIHSVAQTPVTDFFVIKHGQICLESTEYHDFGAGLPHKPQPGQTMRSENGKIFIEGINQVLPEFQLRVGRTARHDLLLLKKMPSGQTEILKTIPLVDLAPPGSAVTFSILPASGL